MIPRTLRLRIAAAAAVLALPLAIAACTSPSGSDSGDVEALFRARARWEALGARSYTFVAGPRCFCGGPREIRTTVVNGVATGRVYVDDGSPADPRFFNEIATVDAMLATVDEALREGAADVRVTYDARGIPTDASIDYRSDMADEEFGWVVTSFTPAP